MPTLVFRLRNVPEDEADDVRTLMDESELDWYETSAGNWGIAMPAIWVTNDEDSPKARDLINNYQTNRQAERRSDYLNAVKIGTAPSLSKRIREQPVKTGGIVLFCLFILYVTLNPFLRLIGYTQ
ncbi:MAG: DUF6164 family protein [Granulosicoccus sp.]